MNRRGFLAAIAATIIGACTRRRGGRADTAAASEEPARATSPFTLGVASGDPNDTSVILWTRLMGSPEEPLDDDVEVAWVVATDPALRQVVSEGTVVASSPSGHTLHVDATGLEPDTWYHYGFVAAGHLSPVGRTRTFPAKGTSTLGVRYGVSSCQNWEDGHYAAHRHAAEDDLDFFVWLGDYVYEGRPVSADVRPHLGGEAVSLDDYRARYAQYKSDASLRAAHEARPWLVTWDDHEVENDYAGAVSVDGDPADAFLRRRRAAYQAWYEHMPVRVPAPDGADLAMYRSSDWADLMRIHLLDTRQHRDDQPTDGASGELLGFGDSAAVGVRAIGPTARDPAHSMLGPTQQAWLVESVSSAQVTWNVLAQSVLMHGMDLGDGLTIVDTWDGYAANRGALLTAIRETGASDVVVLSGDLHSASVGDVKIDPFDPASPVVATEFMAAAISSAFGPAAERLVDRIRPINPQMRFFDARNGYCVCDVTATTWTTTYRAVANVADEDSAVEDIATFVIERGTAGATLVSLTSTQ